MFGALQQGDIQQASELQTRIWFDGIYRDPEQVDAKLRQQVKVMNLNAIQKQGFAVGDAQPLNPLDPPAVTRLSDITVPMLAIAGKLDHPEVVRATTWMTDELSNATHHILDKSAHLPNFEQADSFNRVVNGFLRGLR